MDASVAAMWFVPEELSRLAVALLDAPYECVAPELARIEVANALLRNVRKGNLSAEVASGSLARLRRPVLEFVPFDRFVDDAYRLAQHHGGSVYDAVYVCLAVDELVPLVTNDARLGRTGRAAGIEVCMLADGLPTIP